MEATAIKLGDSNEYLHISPLPGHQVTQFIPKSKFA